MLSFQWGDADGLSAAVHRRRPFSHVWEIATPAGRCRPIKSRTHAIFETLDFSPGRKGQFALVGQFYLFVCWASCISVPEGVPNRREFVVC